MRKIATALVGYGSGGRIYNAPIISSVSEFSITKILTSNPQNIEAAKRDFPEATITPDFSKILEDPAIELVIILLPNHLHFEFAKKALVGGKHVVVEKPITTNVRDAERLIQLAREKNLILSVNHNRRWDSDFRTVQDLIEKDILGEVVNYEVHFDRFRNEIKLGWKENPEFSGAGILYDLGSHLIDQALQLFGKPQQVFADIRVQRKNAQVPDYFELFLYYSNLKVSLNAGTLVKEKGPTITICGTRGSFVKYGTDPQEEALKNGKKPGENQDWGKEPERSWGRINTIDMNRTVESIPGDYRKPYENVHKAITEGAALQVTAEQARDVIKIIELAQESQASQRVIAFR